MEGQPLRDLNGHIFSLTNIQPWLCDPYTRAGQYLDVDSTYAAACRRATLMILQICAYTSVGIACTPTGRSGSMTTLLWTASARHSKASCQLTASSQACFAAAKALILQEECLL